MPMPTDSEILQKLNSAGFTGADQRVIFELIATIRADSNAKFAAVDAWADTLAAKLNLDAGVTDTNYAVLNLPA